MTRHRYGALAGAAMASLLALSPASAADQAGILWQTTSQMIMEGMPFSPPPTTAKFCAAKEWNQPPPPPPDQTCTQTNVQRSGNKISWDMQCTGEMQMSGHGEITFDGTGSYTGTIRYNAEGTNMTVKLAGKKIGECDEPI